MIMERRTVGFSICDILQQSSGANVDTSSLSATNETVSSNLKSDQKASNTPTPTTLIDERIPAIMQEALPLWLTCTPPLSFERNFIVAQRNG